jgi:hypothetical protein
MSRLRSHRSQRVTALTQHAHRHAALLAAAVLAALALLAAGRAWAAGTALTANAARSLPSHALADRAAPAHGTAEQATRPEDAGR